LVETIEDTEGDVAMKSKKVEVARGSGNVFRDVGHKNADAEQLESILAAEIIKALDREGFLAQLSAGVQWRTVAVQLAGE
jgi:hypothetical protein